jgi:Catalytic LigB subunit of aromatic ring-opening dioxygenase
MMARICAALCASHSPFLYAEPEEWAPARASRARHGGIAADVPVDTVAQNAAKHARCNRAFDVLREVLEESRPDLLLVFGDDQREQFDFANFPAFGVFVGADFCGYRIAEKFGLPVPGANRASRPRTDEHWRTVKSHPDFARSLTTALVARGFDVAFSTELPRPDAGIGHAFMRPLHRLMPRDGPAVVPFFVNCYYGPQPTAARCRELGRAIRTVIDASPDDLRIAVIGSGGLWHTPMQPDARLNEAFDRIVLERIEQGDAGALAAFFDAQVPRVAARDGAELMRASGGTGMVLGLGDGTGEVRNWIITAAIMEGAGATVVDYVPIHASPVGAAFAYWRLP